MNNSHGRTLVGQVSPPPLPNHGPQGFVITGHGRTSLLGQNHDGPKRGAADDLESPSGYGQGTFIVLPEVAFASRRFAFSSVILLESHPQVTNDIQHIYEIARRISLSLRLTNFTSDVLRSFRSQYWMLCSKLSTLPVA